MKNRRLNKLLIEVQTAITFDQPLLQATPEADCISVVGTYILTSTADRFVGQNPIASYQIEIDFPLAFPKVEPAVREIGKAIPRSEEYHINRDGSCCIVIWEGWAKSTSNVSVQFFFDGPLKNFFLGQYLNAQTGEWPFGEQRHGKEGLIEAFAERLSCANEEEAVRYLLKVLSKPWLKGHWQCSCGSGLVIRNCCSEMLAELRKDVPAQDAQRMLRRLKLYDQKHRPFWTTKD